MKAKQKARDRHGLKNVARALPGPELLARKVESALGQGQVDVACDLLSQAKHIAGTLDRALGAKAYAAQAYARWDRPGRALASLERAIEMAPEDAALRHLHGNLLRRLGRIKAAIAELAEALRLAPDDRRIAFETLLSRLASGDRGEGLAPLAASLEPASAARASALLAAIHGELPSASRSLAKSTDPVDRLARAVLLLAQGRTENALPSLEMLATQEDLPDAIHAYINLYLGIALVQIRQLALAIEPLNRARAIDAPGDRAKEYLAWVYQQLAIGAVLSGGLSDAGDWFGRLENLGGPDASEARENAVHALRLHGQEQVRYANYHEAIKAWSRALAFAPRDVALRQNLAIALERDGRADEAIAHWHQLLQQIPHVRGKAAGQARGLQDGASEDDLRRHIRSVALTHLADLYLEQDDPDRAIEHLERALQTVPDDVDTRRNLARLLIDEGKPRKALPHFQQVQAAMPDSAGDRLELALAYMASGEEGQGLAQMESALALERDNPLIRRALGAALARRGMSSPGAATAYHDVQRARVLVHPNTPAVVFLAYGAVELARGKRREAAKALKAAVREDPRVILKVGDIYWDAGEREAALATWTDAMKKAKNNAVLYSGLVEAWAKAGDPGRCRECILGAFDSDYALEATEAVERAARSRELQPILRQALLEAIPSTTDLEDRVYLAESLVYVSDVQAARSLLRDVAREAPKRSDAAAIAAVVSLDSRYRLLDYKAAEPMVIWMDANPGVI
ncbi:MAG: tetratricopeptide repeat protein [Dehalococcoidia bacterium]|nr:tetratricopeptide repeat protein [Dehalococcoidia bacterium]